MKQGPTSAFFLIVLLTVVGCAGQVSVPSIVAENLSATPLHRPASLISLQPALKSSGTESLKIAAPDSKIELPANGAPFLYGLTVTEPLERYYQALHSKNWKQALKILQQEQKRAPDALMLYALSFLETQLLMASGQWENLDSTFRLLDQREIKAFGKNLETTALRGEFELWRGNLTAARAEYLKVLTAIGDWRVPTFYMRPPSNNNEIIYFGRAQLRANIGLVGVLILEGNYKSALAWAADAEKRFLDILGLTQHFVYGNYMKATPDLYTSHGWCLVYLAGARIGYSKNLKASDALFEKARDYFSVEGLIDGTALTHSVRENVALRSALMQKPTFQIGMLLEPDTPPTLTRHFEAEGREISGFLASLEMTVRGEGTPFLLKTFVKLPQIGDESPFGFKITSEFQTAFEFYLKGDGEEALIILEGIPFESLKPEVAWSFSFLKAQVLIMMGRSADAEIELEKAGPWEQQAFGTNLNTRSLRGEARSWLGDYDAALADFLQVIEALGNWRLPTSYVFPPADVSQLALRSRAQLRAFTGIATVFMLKGDYAAAQHWARAAENLFKDLFDVLEHPLYRRYIDMDADMVYGRGLNLGILGAAQLAEIKNPERSLNLFLAAKNYFNLLGYPFGQITVDAFQVQVLLDINRIDLAEPIAKQAVQAAIEKGFADIVWQIEALLGEGLLRDNRRDEAEMSFRRAQAAIAEVSGSLGSDRSKRRFGIGKEDITFRLVELDIEKKKWEDLFRDLERGRAQAFVDMLGRQSFEASREAQAVKEIRAIDRNIRRQRLRNAAPDGFTPEGLRKEKAWLGERQLKIQSLRERNPEMADVLSVGSRELSEIQKLLRAGEVLAYALPPHPRENLRFFLIRPQTVEVKTTSLTPELLKERLRIINETSFNSLTLPSPQRGEGKGEGIETILPMTLSNELGLQNWEIEKCLYVVPSGDLHFVPWGALHINYPVVILPTGGWLARSTQSLPAARPASVIGDPETGGSWPKLPGARQEAQIVGKIYGVPALVGEAATETAVRNEVGNGVRVLHLATHGFFDDKNPLDSAVILSTGKEALRLTAAALFEYPLPAGLVVLSACETGLGKAVAGDVFLGLVRSFYLGGAFAVVYSLQPVQDEPARLFMEKFHREGLAGDYGKAWLAARNLLKEKDYPPSVYGAFILGGLGEGRGRQGLRKV